MFLQKLVSASKNLFILNSLISPQKSHISSQKSHISSPKSPIFLQKLSARNDLNVLNSLISSEKSPVSTQKRHIPPQKSHISPQTSPIFPQKGPIFPQKSPVFPQKSPIFWQRLGSASNTVCKRALYLLKIEPHFNKRALFFRKIWARPSRYTKQPDVSEKEPYIYAKEP